MRHQVPSRKQKVSVANQSGFSSPTPRISFISITLLLITFCMCGCVSQHTKAWNHYEEGMLLVYKGYDAKGDKVDKVEKAFNKAIECNKDLPGVRASLGTYKAKKGESASATELWNEEKKIHPESKKAMDVVLEKNKGKEGALAPEKEVAPDKPIAAEIKPGEKQAEPAENEKKSV